jgi:hypothetical protein
MAWHPDGTWLASACDKGMQFARATGQLGPSLTLPCRFRALEWSPEGRYVVYGGAGGILGLFNFQTQEHEWLALLFDDDQALTLSCAGQLLHGDPEVLEKEIVYIIQRTPGGKLETLKPSEFQEHVSAVQAAANVGEGDDKR